jgi:hypothetical protein
MLVPSAISSGSYPLIKPENQDNIISEIIKKPPLRPINDFPFHTHLSANFGSYLYIFG